MKIRYLTKQHQLKKFVLEMASWKTDEDIARDMDILSGIQGHEEKVRSYSSWGRGQNLSLNTLGDISSFSEPQEKTSVEEFNWFPEGETLGKLPDSIGRGKKLELLKANIYRNKEMEVHEQLREVMGPGHSNAYIEESHKRRLGLKSEHKNFPVEQFQDSEAAWTDKKDEYGDQKESIVSKPVDSTSHEVEPKPTERKRRKRQYRNALLESLERMHRSENISVENEFVKTHNPFSTTETGSLFGTGSSSIPPAGYLPGKLSSTYSPKKTGNSFEFNESEFPNL